VTGREDLILAGNDDDDTAILEAEQDDTDAAPDWTFSIPLNLQDQDGAVWEQGPDHPRTTAAAVCETNVPVAWRRAFARDGFVVLGATTAANQCASSTSPPVVVSKEACAALHQRLEEILRGRYSTGRAPDKAPRLFRKTECAGTPAAAAAQERYQQQYQDYYDPNNSSVEQRCHIPKPPPPPAVVGPLGFSGNRQNVRVLQVINAHKADALYRQLACSPVLGKVVAQLAGWDDGVRLAQDQVWAKPPGAPPLAFHRDSPYFMFGPSDEVVTVWIALDDMDEELGPLQYVRGSHLWGEGRVGVASQFFPSNGGVSLLRSAAERQAAADASSAPSSTSSATDARQQQQQTDGGGALEDLEIVSVAGLKLGNLSIHNGRTWHGSGKNASPSRPRRGLGLHFVPANVRFTPDARHSSLWRPYVQDVLAQNGDVSKMELPLQDFPITWQPSDDDDDDDDGTNNKIN